MDGLETNRFGLLCGSLARAGLERVVSDLALGAHRRGTPVTLFAFSDGPLSPELRRAGVDVVVLDRSGRESRGRLRSLRLLARLAAGLRRRRVRCLNMHGLGVERIGLPASRLGGVGRRTFVFHNNYPELSAHTDRPAYRRRVIRDVAAFDGCIAISDRVRDWVVSNDVIGAEKVTVIRNGIDLDQARGRRPRAETRAALGIPADAVVLVQVGRFSEQKNQEIAVAAFAEAAVDRPGAHLILVGDGPLRGRAEQAAADSPAADRIHFLGVRDDVADLLAAADLFLMPSSWEGLPISLLEAFANGLPLVGCDAPGIADTVTDCPETAILVPPRDTGALARAMGQAMADTGWRRTAGAAAEGFVRRHHSADTMVDRYLEAHGHV
jgi:glycosyltransferase involved in cell wall biosynthesis